MGSFQSTLFDPRVGVTLFHINVNVRLAPDGKSVALLGYFLWYAKIQRHEDRHIARDQGAAAEKSPARDRRGKDGFGGGVGEAGSSDETKAAEDSARHS
jgi:hypothetical protein